MRGRWAGGLIAASLAFAPPAAAEAFAQRNVAVAPGVVLHLVEAGHVGVRPPLVFIPGWSASSQIWRGQIDRFAGKYRVISFDPRSQGDSTKTTSGNTPEQRAVDLHALLAAERLDHPVLVGWSQAAQDVAAYASKYGTADLSGIVLVDAAVSDGAKGIAQRPEQASAQFGRFASYVADEQNYLRGMFGFIISKPQAAGVVDRAVAVGMKTPPSIGISELVADMFGNDLTSALARMDCPVLIIAAGNSGELARQQAEAKLIKNAQFVRIDDSSHAVFLDQPDRFEAAVNAFLNRLVGSKQ